MPEASVVWLRRDLRIADLPSLGAAIDDGGPVTVCFVLDPRLEASSGARRLAFLYDSLRDVDAALGGRLVVLRGRPEVEIVRLARSVDAGTVHVSADYTPFGRRRDDRVRQALGRIAWEEVGSPYLVSPGRVQKADGDPYKVFTPYFRQWLDHGWRAPAQSAVEDATVVDPDEVRVPNRIEIPASPTTLTLPAGETAARGRWAEFADGHLADYHELRDRPDRDAGSQMSAYLKFGNIHPRTMAADLGSGPGPQAYLRELAFRDFYADVLFHWPESLWRNWNRGFDNIELDTGDEARARFDAWRSGHTGFPLVDAGMRQLAETGYMHNRVRMLVASFLVKDLHLPWWWGARWFLDQLVDGDMASNQHGWQWAAGTGTDAAPYFRVFNPQTQAARFDPDERYVHRWIPELDTDDYPDPIVDHKTERAEALRRYRSL
ncbi:deoxyribodipyrimidine photo-lyase [Gordonia sp. ABSL1-1]|uniref:cryptochrome/photolyase family protein n=1 Tax=Gordonia sp. ABSL1-1 TaxID=3053923 RepID=UPI002572AF18|nr:deoxyribodipyrimidine photo-lyase [Gordonia sp. ABSL1-1]MDL9938017.1 deoxyribodipyrimidine photo-lyase [Gordonia sp. ABSL1-1]